MKRFLAIALCLCALVTTACAKQPADPGMSADPVTLYLECEGYMTPDEASAAGKTLSPADPYYKFNYLQQQLDGAGYAITVKPAQTYAELMADPEQTDALVAALAENITQGNTVALLSQETCALLDAQGVSLGDIQAKAREFAPEFMKNAASVLTDVPAGRLPASYSTALPKTRTAVTIRGGIYEMYNKEIADWDQFVTFLEYAKANHPDVFPGRFPSFEYYGLGNAMPLYDLYLQGSGYVFLDQYVRDGLHLVLTPEGEIARFETLPIFQEMLLAVDDLKARDLIKVTYGDSAAFYDSLDYAATLVNTATYQSESFGRAMAVDMNKYMVFPLDTPTPYTLNTAVKQPYYCVMGASAEAQEFLRFLEALNQDQTLYRTILLGRSGVDYQAETTTVLRATFAKVDYTMWEVTRRFANDAQGEQIRPARLPYHFSDSLADFTYSYDETLAAAVNKLNAATATLDADTRDALLQDRHTTIEFIWALMQNPEPLGEEGIAALLETLTGEPHPALAEVLLVANEG